MHGSETGDQAAGLRDLTNARPVKVIAVTSGKGGVGKTNAAVNLAVALSQRGRSTLLLDADLGLANVDVLLGLRPEANLAHVLAGELTLEEILITGPAGLRIVPAASGVGHLANLSANEQSGLMHAFNTLPFNPEVLVVDTAAGIDRTVVTFCQAAHEVVVVVCDEPASLTDAYALIKLLSREHGASRFQVLASMARDETAGRALHRKLLAVCDQFLDVSLGYLGAVPQDELLRRAVCRQQAVVAAFPGSPSARAFKEIARRADAWSVASANRGCMEFFLERLVSAAAPGSASMAE